MVNLFINVYIYLGTRWHNHTGSVTEFWKYARLLNMVSVTCIISIPAPLFKRGRGTGGREAEGLLLTPLRGYFIVRIHMNTLTHHKMPSHHIDEKYDK